MLDALLWTLGVRQSHCDFADAANSLACDDGGKALEHRDDHPLSGHGAAGRTEKSLIGPCKVEKVSPIGQQCSPQITTSYDTESTIRRRPPEVPPVHRYPGGNVGVAKVLLSSPMN